MPAKSGGTSKDAKRMQKFKKLMQKYGYLLNLEPKDLPKKHKAKLGGGLRCFQRVYPRDDNGNKMREFARVRCGNPTARGSFYCRNHGGGNSYALVHGKSTMNKHTGGAYGRGMPVEFSDLLEEFMNDPNITDLRPELSALRMALARYLEELTSDTTKEQPVNLIRQIKRILKDETSSNLERFIMVRDLCASQSFITDGESLDRLNKTVETISKIAERMHRIQSKDNYILTPDGLKIFLRAIVDILQEKIIDPKILKEIRDKLMEIHTRTEGDLYKVDDAEYREV